MNVHLFNIFNLPLCLSTVAVKGNVRFLFHYVVSGIILTARLRTFAVSSLTDCWFSERERVPPSGWMIEWPPQNHSRIHSQQTERNVYEYKCMRFLNDRTEITYRHTHIHTWTSKYTFMHIHTNTHTQACIWLEQSITFRLHHTHPLLFSFSNFKKMWACCTVFPINSCSEWEYMTLCWAWWTAEGPLLPSSERGSVLTKDN